MQPHSISALAVARHVFGHDKKIPKTAEVGIKYKKWNGIEWEDKKLYQTVTKVKPILKIEKDENNHTFYNLKGLMVSVKASDSMSCDIKIERSSDGDFSKGSEKLYATHSVQHVAGLTEIYTVDRSTISGDHRGSKKYRTFTASGNHEGFFKLSCKVRKISIVKDRENTDFVDVDYIVTFSPSY